MNEHKWGFALVAAAVILMTPAYSAYYDFSPAGLEQQVDDALKAEGFMEPRQFSVLVESDVVTLQGAVDDAETAADIERVVTGVRGVRELRSRLSVGAAAAAKVDYDFSQRIEDMTLLADVRTRLLSSHDINALNVEVSVNNGTAILSGNVDSQAQREKAEKIVRELRGVQDVENNLVVPLQATAGSER